MGRVPGRPLPYLAGRPADLGVPNRPQIYKFYIVGANTDLMWTWYGVGVV